MGEQTVKPRPVYHVLASARSIRPTAPSKGLWHSLYLYTVVQFELVEELQDVHRLLRAEDCWRRAKARGRSRQDTRPAHDASRNVLTTTVADFDENHHMNVSRRCRQLSWSRGFTEVSSSREGAKRERFEEGQHKSSGDPIRMRSRLGCCARVSHEDPLTQPLPPLPHSAHRNCL